MPEPTRHFSAKDAAARYAEDSAFASEFERALHDIYVEHLETLKRIERRLGNATDEASAAPSPAPSLPAATTGAVLITPERVQEIINSSPVKGLTRGDIAARLGINSRDVRLTRVLQALKVDHRVRQTGVRRSARYHTTTRSNSGR